MVKKWHFEYFDPRRTELAQEVKNHPELAEILANMQSEQGIDSSEFELRLAACASYCGIILDGEYLPSDLNKLCGILVEKLRKKRTIIIS